MTLKAILKNKPSGVVSVPPQTPVGAVIELLAQRAIGAVLVIDHLGQMQGILSERAIVRSLARDAGGTFDLAAAQLMTKNPRTASPETTVVEAMEMMTEGRFRHLPVVDDAQLIGVVSIGDVVKARITQQEHEVDSLRAYVVGAAP